LQAFDLPVLYEALLVRMPENPVDYWTLPMCAALLESRHLDCIYSTIFSSLDVSE